MTPGNHAPVLAAVILATTLIASPVTADDSEPPPPYDGQTVALQSLAAGGTTTALAVGSWALLTMPTPAGSYGTSYTGAAGLLFQLTPVLAPIPTNLVGNARGYPNQYAGAHLGALAGSFVVGAATGAILAASGDSILALMGAAGGFLVGATAGSVIGYHIQASMRQNRDDETEAQITPMLKPFAEPDTDRWGFTAGWQGRF